MIHRASVRARGFTLAEVVVTTVIVGMVFVAAITALEYSGRANFAIADMSRAMTIARESREWTVSLPFRDPDPWDQDNPPGADSYSGGQPFVDDLDDLMDTTFQPPRDSENQPMVGVPNWAHHFNLTWRDPSDLDRVITPGASDIIHVELTVFFDGEEVEQYGWLITDLGVLDEDD